MPRSSSLTWKAIHAFNLPLMQGNKSFALSTLTRTAASVKSKKWLGFASTLGVLFLADTFLYDRTFQRNIRTLWNGLIITIDYKWNFTPGNADKIDSLHERVAERILHVCKKNAGLYIKFGQQIASINHVLPPQYSKTFRVLYDEAPVVSAEEVDKLFMEDTGKKPSEIFKEWNYVPVASASIAQVHKAKLPDGTPVAVKVQKPYIANQMHWDLTTYRLLVFLFEKIFDLPIYWSVDIIESHLKTEVDFINEGKNSEQANQHIQESAELKGFFHVPKVHWDHSSKRILACEWIDAMKFGNKEDMEKAGFDVAVVMEKVIDVFSDQIFRAGFIHCDPHPGNILLRKNPDGKYPFQIVLLDHGLYTKASPQFTVQYATFWTSLFTMDLEKIQQIASSWGIKDTQMFASATLQKPWKPGSNLNEQRNYSMQDVFEMQTAAKEKVRDFLSDSKLIPQELVFIGRNLNIIRSNNKVLGSPVNRVSIMASYAAKNCGSQYQIWKFRFTWFMLSFSFYLSKAFEYISKLLGKKSRNFEELMDDAISASMYQQYGIKIDISAFDG